MTFDPNRLKLSKLTQNQKNAPCELKRFVYSLEVKCPTSILMTPYDINIQLRRNNLNSPVQLLVSLIFINPT